MKNSFLKQYSLSQAFRTANSSEKLFYILLLFNIIVVLIPTWKGSFIARYMDIEDFVSLANRIARFLNLIIALLLITKHPAKQSPIFKVSLILLGVMFLSKLANFTFEEATQPIDFFIFNVALFCSFKPSCLHTNIFKIVTLLFVIWSIAPVLYFPIAPASDKMMLYATDPDASDLATTFCGFAKHRNVYGYYCSVAFILTLFSDYKKYLKAILLTIMGIGLFMAASRSNMIGLAVAVVYYYFFTGSFKQKIVFTAIVAAIIYYGYGVAVSTESRILEGGGRDDINRSSYELFIQSPIFGYGKGTATNITNYRGGKLPPHNYIFSTLLDYGIVALIPFLIFLFILYKVSGRKSRTFLLYIYTVGISQPCFGLYSPAQIQLIIFLLVIAFNAKQDVEKKKKFKHLVYHARNR